MKNLKSIVVFLFLSIILTSCAQNHDNIIGVWNVKTDYYQAVYEIVENEKTFYGKIHYYNDGTNEVKEDDGKDNYFLTGIEKKGKQYKNGKMYLPDGSYYEVVFTLKDANTLELKMTFQGEPYKEVWQRKSNYN